MSENSKRGIKVCVEVPPKSGPKVFHTSVADDVLRQLADAPGTEFTSAELVDVTGAARSTVWRAVDLLDEMGAVRVRETPQRNYVAVDTERLLTDDPILAISAVAVSLLAGQICFARSAALEQTGQAFVKMLRAKGADRRRLAQHVLRNAAIPIVSLSMTELLAVLVLNIYIIEAVVGIDGLAGATLRAIRDSDTALVIWTTMVVVFIGIVGNFLQDVLYGSLDRSDFQ